MKISKTVRGFELINFKDRYNVPCSLQKSSLATEEAVWFGPNDAAPKIMASQTPEGGAGWVPFNIPEDVSLTTRAHLTRPMVEELIAHLQAWLQTGSFKLK
jgi:hypothetical protein